MQLKTLEKLVPLDDHSSHLFLSSFFQDTSEDCHYF